MNNVSNSNLEFRKQLLDLDTLNTGDTMSKHLGAVQTIPGRCIFFTNDMQHRVMEFGKINKE